MAESVLAQFPLTVVSQLVQQTSVQIEQSKEAAEEAAKEEEQKSSTSALQASAPISGTETASGDRQSDNSDSESSGSADGRGGKVNIET